MRLWSTVAILLALCRGDIPTDPCAEVRATGEPAPSSGLVLVTGGSGFIGSHLVELLLGLGYAVRVLDNFSTGDAGYLPLRGRANLEVVYGDIRDKAALREAVKGVVGVFHLAAMSKVKPSLSDPSIATYAVETNALGTANLLEAAAAEGNVSKIVYAASSTFYGNQPTPHEETASFSPSSPYAATKYQGELEMLTWDRVYALPTINLRFFMVYGPRQPTTGAYAIVTGIFAEQKKQGVPLTVEGSGDHFRDFVHVRDVARGLVMAFQHPSLRATAVNLGSGRAVCIHELADMVSSNQEHLPPRPYDLEGTLADTCRAKQLLNFEAKEDFASTMRDLIDSQDSHLDQLFWPRVAFSRGQPALNASREARNWFARSVLAGDGEADALDSVETLDVTRDLVLAGLTNLDELGTESSAIWPFFTRVYIYRTGGSASCAATEAFLRAHTQLEHVECVERENLGLDVAGFTEHVIQHYDALGDVVVFSPTHLTAHERIEKIVRMSLVVEPLTCALMKKNLCHTAHTQKFHRDKNGWAGKPEPSKPRPMNAWAAARNVTGVDWNNLNCCATAVVKTKGAYLRERPLAFYTTILADLLVSDHPEASYFYERLAAPILGGLQSDMRHTTAYLEFG